MPGVLEGLAIVALLVLGLPLVLSIIAYNKSARLGSRLAALEAAAARLDAGLTAKAADVPPVPLPELPAAVSESIAGPVPTPVAAAAAAPLAPVLPAAPAPPARQGIEEKLTSRWLLWLGALALVLSGLFLISYAIDNGLLTPAMRVTAGLALGAGLAAAGEWLRRRPLEHRIASVRPDHVAGALVSAGLFICFASVYGAYGLYGLLSPSVAFVGLAAVALAAFALAALHAPVVAILGLLAGFATPALVSSQEPSASLLFAYLALIVAASLAVVRYRSWAWLAFGAVAGGVLWALAWIAFAMKPGDIFPVAGFLAFTAAAAIWLALAETEPEAPEIWQGLRQVRLPEWCGWFAAAAAALSSAAAVIVAGAGSVELVLLAVLFVAAALGGRRWQRFDGLFILANLAR